MRALVVYESMFGNTRSIAHAVTQGLSRQMEATAVEVGDAPPALGDDVDLLVVGAPTHAFGLSRPGTRQSAVDQGAPTAPSVPSTGIGLREWIEQLPTAPATAAGTAFDTRINKPRMPGSAARAAARRLRRLGLTAAAPPASFYVTGTAGPLVPGETDRARQWAENLASSFAAARGTG